MASKLRRAQRGRKPLRLLLWASNGQERWRWEQDVVHQRKPRHAGRPHVEPPPPDCMWWARQKSDGMQMATEDTGRVGGVERTGVVKEADDETTCGVPR